MAAEVAEQPDEEGVWREVERLSQHTRRVEVVGDGAGVTGYVVHGEAGNLALQCELGEAAVHDGGVGPAHGPADHLDHVELLVGGDLVCLAPEKLAGLLLAEGRGQVGGLVVGGEGAQEVGQHQVVAHHHATELDCRPVGEEVVATVGEEVQEHVVLRGVDLLGA